LYDFFQRKLETLPDQRAFALAPLWDRQRKHKVTKDEIKAALKAHIAAQVLPGEDPDVLDEAKLVSDGLLDSLESLKLVSHLEEKYGVRIAAHEVDAEHLDTLDAIADMVLAKRR
jgi:acyl carrier protein